MIVPAGVFVPAHRAPFIAAALRLLAERNGGAPAWMQQQIAEFEAAALSVTTSAFGEAEVPKPLPQRSLQDVNYVGTRLAANRLGIDDRSVRDLCQRGSLEAERVGKRWLITNDAIDEYLRNRKGHR
jgi:excisionase family DNA binding protein